MRLKLKTVVATLTFALAFALVGSPSAPVAKVVPTVGGVAHAYAPCDMLLWNMMRAAQAYARYRDEYHLAELQRAAADFFDHCSP